MAVLRSIFEQSLKFARFNDTRFYGVKFLLKLIIAASLSKNLDAGRDAINFRNFERQVSIGQLSDATLQILK